MIGSSAPLYDSCIPLEGGLGFRQCEASKPPIVELAVSISLAVVVLGILVFRFERFVRRRHGGVVPYTTARLLALRRLLRRLKVLHMQIVAGSAALVSSPAVCPVRLWVASFTSRYNMMMSNHVYI